MDMPTPLSLEMAARAGNRACVGWTCAVEHRQPENAPTDDAKNRDRIGEPFRRAQSRLLRVAPRFQDFVARLDFPAHGIAIKFFNCLAPGCDRQVGD